MTNSPAFFPRLAGVLALLLPLLWVAAVASPVRAEDAQMARIATMSVPELGKLVGLVTVTIGQDALKMRDAAQRQDCLELIRTANSFALGYDYLAAAKEALADKPAKQADPLRATILQSRVLAFAARSRAEQWLGGCTSFVVPADLAGDPRYAKTARLENAEFTQAVIEARQGADAQLANAAAAAATRKCPAVISAAQGLELYLPYLEALLKDMAKRPEALGPRASRTGLNASRARLIQAGNQLAQEFSPLCSKPAAKTP